MANKDLSVNQRIKFLIENHLQLTQRAFAGKIGVSQSAVSSLFSQRENRPGLDMLQKIAMAYPEVSLNWLLMGEGEMLVPRQSTPVPTPTPLAQHQARPGDFLPANAMQHQDEREVAYQQAVAQHERLVSVVRALVEYCAQMDPSSPELRAISDMLPAVLTPPLSPEQEDNLYDQRVEEWERQEEALSDEAHEREMEAWRKQGNH